MNSLQHPVVEPAARPEEPERFPPALLEQPPAVRQEHFESRCLIEHPRLLDAVEATMQAICAPGNGTSTRRPGTMVLVIGPSRVGKTTLIRLLEERLLVRGAAQMRQDCGYQPWARITAPGSETGRFDWQDYYKAVLRGFQDPFVDGRTARIPTRELREAMEMALLERKPLAIIVDEAHHLAKATNGRRLQDQLDHLKHIENLTSVSHVLVGTYELRPFRTVNAQLACRSVDVHFPRYDATNAEDCRIFRSVLWALQRQLPVADEPPLADQHWQFLYARSIGCIGLLKLHLNRALNLALTEEASSVTGTHLRKTALSAARVELALRHALESEADLVEADGTDERLLALLGVHTSLMPAARPSKPAEGAQRPLATMSRSHRHQPGRRKEGRDALAAVAGAEERATG